MTPAELEQLAERARYVGSQHHKDVPSMGLVPAPRKGAIQFDMAEAQDIDNPDCLLCPRKWARMLKEATELLRAGIRSGQVTEDAGIDSLPSRVWVRDADDERIVYEAKRLTPPNDDGYKAYPLTSRQARALPLTVR
jgi:hypothetical protein